MRALSRDVLEVTPQGQPSCRCRFLCSCLLDAPVVSVTPSSDLSSLLTVYQPLCSVQGRVGWTCRVTGDMGGTKWLGKAILACKKGCSEATFKLGAEV